jgi:uncharacterized membrane protein YheB (UPF0754 family)
MPYTKKQLEGRFNIGRSTVYNRLKDCGLDANKNEYSDEEVENVFKVACEMMQQGHSQEDVRRRFNVGEVKKTTVEKNNIPPPNSAVNNGHAASNITEAVSANVKNLLDKEIGRAVEEAIPFIPYMIEQKLIEYIQSGTLNQALFNYQEKQQQRHNEYYSSSSFIEQGYPALSSDDTSLEHPDDED